MPTTITQDLKYGIIYVCGNPKQTHNLRWFASTIEPMIRPLSLQWVNTWEIDHTLIVARRFNVGNIGKYATVQLHLNKYGHSDSFSLLAALHAFSDCLEDVMDDSEGDVIINEEDYRDRNALPEGKWGTSQASIPFNDVLRDIVVDDMPQDHTRVELPKPNAPWSYFNKEADKDEVDANQALEECLETKPHRRLSFNRLNKLRKLKEKKGRLFPPKKQDAEEELIVREEQERLRKEEEERILREEQIIAYEESRSCDDDLMGMSSADTSIDDANMDYMQPNIEPEPVDVEAEEVREYERINSEYERDVRDLRARIVAFIAKYHQDPQQVMTMMLEGKVLLGATPGHVLVNGDMKIVLPEYDEMEIKMPAMSRTLYILFMKHRLQSGSGIILKNIDQYRDEIIDIYSLVKPRANEDRVVDSVNNLCDPFSDALNQAISRANRCIRNVITDQQLAKQYIITGNRGEEYSIGLAPELMTLPRAVTQA